MTVNPELVRVADMLVMDGADGTTATVRLGTGEGVISTLLASNCTEMKRFPATVPDCNPMVVKADVWPAGIIRVAVFPPLANCTAGSEVLEVKVNFTVISTG